MRFLTIGVHLKFSVYITNPYFGFGELGGRGGSYGTNFYLNRVKKTYSYFFFIN